MTGPAPLVEVRGLRHRYPNGVLALDGVDFTLLAGESVVVLGANGSGKSTFALHLNGLLTPTTGSVRVSGLPVAPPHLAEVRRRVGFLFQHPDEQLFLPTVREDVAFGLLAAGNSPEQAGQQAAALLARVGVTHLAERSPHHLSAGEKRRVALAGVLALEPQLLLLDEPTTHLDPPGLRDLIRLLRQVNLPMLVITHDVAFARRLTSRAVFFERGRVAADGPVDEVVRQFAWDSAD